MQSGPNIQANKRIELTGVDPDIFKLKKHKN